VDAEEFLAAELDARGLWASRVPLAEATVRRFGDLVAGAAEPIDDVRGSAAYRRHSLSVLARRTLTWAWRSYREESR
jgi:CO/xanthine dehydrogenase FAD-binding subunit